MHARTNTHARTHVCAIKRPCGASLTHRPKQPLDAVIPRFMTAKTSRWFACRALLPPGCRAIVTGCQSKRASNGVALAGLLFLNRLVDNANSSESGPDQDCCGGPAGMEGATAPDSTALQGESRRSAARGSGQQPSLGRGASAATRRATCRGADPVRRPSNLLCVAHSTALARAPS